MKRHINTPLALVMGLGLAITADARSSVMVNMNAAFPAAPYLLELVETAAGENSTAYFPLLDRVASGYFTSSSSDEELYDKFLSVLRGDGHITAPESISTFNLALSLRTAAPRIEAHYQYYSTAVQPIVGQTACDAWVLLDGKQYCTPAMDVAEQDGFSADLSTKALPFDRTLGAGREAVLYADPTSHNFAAYHVSLSKAARQSNINYRIRYRRSNAAGKGVLPVSGYGVELALKSTDYIVIDDRNAPKDSPNSHVETGSTLDGDEEITDLKPLSTSELASMGLKAAAFVQQSDEPFDTLVKLTQDFPKYSSFIAAHNLSNAFTEEHEKNRARMVRGGLNVLWLNGAQLIDRQIEPFTLVNMLRRERSLISGIRDLGLNGKQAVALLSHEKVSSAKNDDEAVRYDWTDRLEDGRVIIWLNDLENDARYQTYPKTVSSLLQRTFPGQIPPIGRNIFNLIIPADFSDSTDLRFISEVESIMDRGIPIRFGLVPLQTSKAALQQAKFVYFLSENYGVEAVLDYLRQLIKSKQASPSDTLLSYVMKHHELLPSGHEMTFSTILETESYTLQTKFGSKWISRLKADSDTRSMFIDGIAIPQDQNWMQTVSIKVGEDLQSVQKGIFHGLLDDDTWIAGMFLEGAAARRNPYISVDSEKHLQILDVAKVYSANQEVYDNIAILDSYTDSTKENWAVATVLTDTTTDEGLQFLLSALLFKRDNPAIRLELIDSQEDSLASGQVNSALKANREKLSDAQSIDELRDIIATSSAYGTKGSFAKALSRFFADNRLQNASQLVVLNGRIVGPMTPDVPFAADDFQQLLEFEQSRRILPVYSAMTDLGLSDKLTDPVAAAKVTSITALSTISDLPEGIFDSAPPIRTAIYDSWDTAHTAIQIGDPAKASIHIVGLLDPVSETGQKWASILKVLSELDGVYIKLLLNPKEKIDELPVKRFFRYVLDSTPRFDELGNVKGSTATFSSLPSEALLTVGMDVPPAWLVAPKVSIHDLDNVKLSSVNSDVEATYELQNILIEGHSREDQGSAPRGAQLVLGTEKSPSLTDTLIMANLGFFQFKANPGFYNIRLKDGRSSDIYTIESIGAQGWEPVKGDEGTELVLMDFQGTTVYPRLKRQPGKEQEDVLQDSGAGTEPNMVAKGLKFAGDLFGNSKARSVSSDAHAEINIFSVASGHLYERMLNIMMVSVMRNTRHSVKFWFIEQFLSPSFKEFIPHLAEEYGFKYEMVTFKWPHWLRQQTEKQREIWGYKILFLDVLFPLSLDKVIFVDADQIVRTDMIDLVNLDLEGAPYAFTPMCDSRTEMEGFRFWKQGYWANYLRGKPYHISALYVVDLRRFRELAAGDRLRQQYHALSADPGSLSNLDQDLPNHMQFQIPIHSLPQEWLWCETWCSDDSLANARTIDLCNNPETKEPKLDRARRQVPEWTVYDEEIAALDARRKGERQSPPATNIPGTGHGADSSEHTRDEL